MVNPKSSVFLFIGDDSYLKEKAIKDLATSLPGDSPVPLDCKTFYGGEAEANEVIDTINTIPFLASKRLVIIKGLEKASSEFKARLAQYIRKPSKTACLVLESSDDSLLEEDGDLARHMNVRRFGEITGSEIGSRIKEFLAARDKKIEPDAISLLKEMHGQNLSSLMQELEKLSSFTGARASVKAADVEAVAGKSLVASTFDLADAIGSRKTEKALRICHDLITAGKKEYEIIGLLSWHFKRLLKAKTLKARGESDNRIAFAVRIGQKYAAGFFRQVAGLGMGQIKSGIRTLLAADLDIKRTRFDPTLVLEFAILRLCKNS